MQVNLESSKISESWSVVTSPLGPAERFHLAVSDSPDPQRPLSLPNLESDGRAFHGNHLAYQLHEICDRTSLFAGIDAEERFFLLLRGPLVYVDHGAPVTFQDVSGDMYDERHGKARYIHIVDLSFSK